MGYRTSPSSTWARVRKEGKTEREGGRERKVGEDREKRKKKKLNGMWYVEPLSQMRNPAATAWPRFPAGQ